MEYSELEKEEFFIMARQCVVTMQQAFHRLLETFPIIQLQFYSHLVTEHQENCKATVFSMCIQFSWSVLFPFNSPFTLEKYKHREFIKIKEQTGKFCKKGTKAPAGMFCLSSRSRKGTKGRKDCFYK